MSELMSLSSKDDERAQISTYALLKPPTQSAARRLSPAGFEKAALFGDLFVILLSGVISSFFYKWLTDGTSLRGLGVLEISVVCGINFLLINAIRQCYRLKKLQQRESQMKDVILVWVVICGILAMAGFTMKVSSEYSRGATMVFLTMGVVSLLAWRMLLRRRIAQAFASDGFAKRKIIVVTERQRSASSQLRELRRHGNVPIEVCCLSDIEASMSAGSRSLSSKLDGVVKLARNERVDAVYLLIGWNYHNAIDVVVHALGTLAVPLYLLPDESASRFLRSPSVEIGDTWAVPIKRLPLSSAELLLKRALDLLGASFGLLALLPLFLIVAAVIKLDSRGPVFFRQTRNGFNGHAFNIYKFRSMHVHDDRGDVKQAVIGDARVTRVGRWLRGSSIDEVPQLLNVLSGEMSLVGPRPHAVAHNSKYETEIASYAFRHHVKPGLTGWAQVNGFRGETPRVEMMQQRIEHDLWYINNWSFVLDVRIMVKTVLISLFQRAAY